MAKSTDYFIDEDEVKRALGLIKELTIRVLAQNINPLAMRIALKVALYMDDIEAKQKLDSEQEAGLEDFARKLVEISENGGI